MCAKVMEVYLTKTRAEYDYLMRELEDYGCVWWSGEKPTALDLWEWRKGNTCIFLNEDHTIFSNDVTYAFEKSFDLIPVILPTTQGTTDNVTKPRHYQGEYGLEVEEVLRNFIPRYENGYTAHRVSSAIEYLLRAPSKNGLEDIKKAYHCIGLVLEEVSEDEVI